MIENPKLFMVLLGCTPKGRTTEQHDVFFGIANSLNDLVTEMNEFWPEAERKLHIDVWREITNVNGFKIEIIPKETAESSNLNLFFLNLGGYKPGEFEEYHYKMLDVSKDLASAIKTAKKTSFYKHYRFKGAVTHIDEKYGIDVDDSHNVSDLLSANAKQSYQIKISSVDLFLDEDELHIGYLKVKSK